MAPRRTPPSTDVVTLEPIILLWVLRMLVPLGGYRDFLRTVGFGNDTIAEVIGLGHWFNVPADKFDQRALQSELRDLHREAERSWKKATVPAQLCRNIGKLAGLLGLNPIDCRILEFAVLLNSERLLNDASDFLREMTSAKVYCTLSVILDLPEPEIRDALSARGLLAQCGLVSVERCGAGYLFTKLDLLSVGFADQMLSGDADPVGLLRGTVTPSGAAQLHLAHYDHIRSSLDILVPYLRHTTQSGRRGVNILLHGTPGTGKTQLVRTLAAELGCELFEVASENFEGDPLNGERRLRAFRAAQCFFARSRTLIAFDEVEDVFNDGNQIAGQKSTAQKCKAWINRMLEDNPVPTMWLSNSLTGLDPAFIRRFDMVVELPVPPKAQRERILQEQCGDLLGSAHIARIAEAEALAPAVVARASGVVRSIRDELGPEGGASAFEHLICNTLEAQGHRPLLPNDPNRLPEVYDPAFIHADTDLAGIAAGLAKSRAGRICLYGPPGTGKTAYGRWLAGQLGMRLMVKRASDLMSMWVGGNEKNIARAFRQAAQDEALLLIDEVDGFLRDRRQASEEWEQRLVNEMLTQMESFPGIFIASTNLMEGLDQAALRRFDLKTKFDFMRPEQAWALFCRYCTMLDLETPQALKPRVMRQSRLTPGDFAAVMRQHRFRPIDSPASLITALEAECAIKEGASTGIGFV